LLERDGFLKREMPCHKAVHAVAAVHDVLFDAFFERQNRGGGLLVIHGDTLSVKPYYTTLWLRLNKISVRREDWKDRTAPGNAPDILVGAQIYCGHKVGDGRSRGVDLIGEGHLNLTLFAPDQARGQASQESRIIARMTGLSAVSGYL
ncbi:MAG: hypothetical protein ABL983_21630, partial [Nitrospira sp.]